MNSGITSKGCIMRLVRPILPTFYSILLLYAYPKSVCLYKVHYITLIITTEMSSPMRNKIGIGIHDHLPIRRPYDFA